MRLSKTFVTQLSLGLLIAMAGPGSVSGQPAKDAGWGRVTEDERAIKIETDKLEAVIPKKNPKRWMTGIEKQSFLDKTTGFREVGDGLMVVDWLMEAGSDEDLWRPNSSHPIQARHRPLFVAHQRNGPGKESLSHQPPRQQSS
jgi:hypothetical protein